MEIAKRLRLSWQLAITVLLAVAMVSTPFLGTATAQAASNAQKGTSLTTVTNSVTGANSVSQVVYYSAKQELSDGGTRYIFNINGVENTLHVPPDGFSPVTATAAQLSEYGFPARPTDVTKLAEWQTQWSSFKYRRPVAEPTITVRPSPEKTNVASSSIETTDTGTSIIKPAIEDGQITENNWSGYMDVAPGEDSEFDNVSGRFYQPYYTGPGVESSWVGLGGHYTQSLIQAGTTIESSVPYAWFEYLNATSNWENCPSTITVHQGDQLVDTVFWTSGSSPYASFFVEDNTTNTEFYDTESMSSSYYDGESAEYIEERPTINKTLTDLADYGDVYWYNCLVNSSTDAFNPALGYYCIDMNSTLDPELYLSEPVTPPDSESSFTDVWKASY